MWFIPLFKVLQFGILAKLRWNSGYVLLKFRRVLMKFRRSWSEMMVGRANHKYVYIYIYIYVLYIHIYIYIYVYIHTHIYIYIYILHIYIYIYICIHTGNPPTKKEEKKKHNSAFPQPPYLGAPSLYKCVCPHLASFSKIVVDRRLKKDIQAYTIYIYIYIYIYTYIHAHM